MSIEVRSLQAHEIDNVCQLLISNGWAHRIKNAAWFESLVKNSEHCIVALVDNVLVGFARAISDNLSNGYISMVVVLPTYRRQGIGRALIEFIVFQNTGITWVLRAGRDDASEFFTGLGFKPSSEAMELQRQST